MEFTIAGRARQETLTISECVPWMLKGHSAVSEGKLERPEGVGRMGCGGGLQI